MPHPPEMEQWWVPLCSRVLAGDPTAEQELCLRLRPGVKLLLRRHLGERAVPNDTDNMLALLIADIKQGRVPDPKTLPQYGRSLIASYARSQIQERSRADAIRNVAEQATSDAGRQQESTERLEAVSIMRIVLDEMSPIGREVIARYYDEMASPETICRELKISFEQFSKFKSYAKDRFMGLMALRVGSANDEEVASQRKRPNLVKRMLSRAQSAS